jgi:hypothetical protein
MKDRRQRRQQQARRRFAELLMDGLRRQGVAEPIRYDPAGIKLVILTGPGEPVTLHLDALFRLYCDKPPAEQPAFLHRLVCTGLAVIQTSRPLSADEGMRRLLPRVRPRSYYESWNLAEHGLVSPPAKWPYQLLAEFLAVGLVLDFPNAARHVDDQLLRVWGLGSDEAFQLARQYLANNSRAAFHSPAPGVLVSPWRDNYDASRLCLAELIHQHEVRGDHVVAVPAAHTLVVTGSEEPNGLSFLLDQAAGAFRAESPVTALPLCLSGGRWAPLDLPPGHPEQVRLRQLRLWAAAQEYLRQGRPRDFVHGPDGKRYHVATCMVGHDPGTGGPHSVCTWTRNVRAVLPRCDYIGFMQPEGTVFQVRAVGTWERVEEVVGPLQPLGLYPERYRVEQFPTEDQLAAIGMAISPPGGTAVDIGRCIPPPTFGSGAGD